MEAGKVYTLNVKYTIKDGELGFELEVDHSTEVIDDTIVFEPVSTGLAPSGMYEIWAGHATVHADVDEAEFSDPSAIKFAYRPQAMATGKVLMQLVARKVSMRLYSRDLPLRQSMNTSLSSQARTRETP